MASEEFMELVATAIATLSDELRATQVAQQLIAIQLNQLAPDQAKALSETMKNIANSESVETSDVAKHHLNNISQHLIGNIETPIVGLYKVEPNSKDPLHWLLGVIDGGKK